MKSNPRLIKYFLFNAKRFFVDADEFVDLSDQFSKPSWWTYLDLFFPFILVGCCIFTKTLPDFMALFSLYKSFMTWFDWIRYTQLRNQFDEWFQIVDATGGPFITSNDPKYDPYVIADGMQRLYDSIFKYLK